MEWDGLEAWGKGELQSGGSPTQLHASWRITCLSLDGPVDDTQFLDKDLVQVLTLWLENPGQATNPGFTISYHRSGIVQVDPHPSNFQAIVANKSFWRTPSLRLSTGSTKSTAQDVGEQHMRNVNGQQQSLHVPFEMLGHFIKWEIKTIKEAAHGAVRSCRHHFAWVHEGFHNFSERLHDKFCQGEPYNSNSLSTFLGKSSHASPLSIENLVEASSQPKLASGTVTEPLDSTNNFPSPTTSHARLPSQTRSLTFPEGSGSTVNTRPLDPDYGSVIDYVKPISIIILVASILMLIMKYLRDPRRRADLAARREERRNRRLYRHAARKQQWRNWIRNFRSNYCPVTQIVNSWDEKRSRVIEQEEVLESVMKDEIRTLRNAHRAVSGVSAAEEGRNNYIYEPEGSERRRSVVTLPGYDSEGTQPPGYDENRMRVVGLRYTLAESEDTPDSSVISTSPRISRDGRDSDFGKEFEWSLEPRPGFGFQA